MRKRKRHTVVGSHAIAVVRRFYPRVNKVSDGDSNAHIEVTPADIRKEGRGKHSECALAIACKRKFNLDGVIISRTTAYLVKGTQARRFKLPISAQKEVVSFDRGADFEAGEYELQRPGKSQRLGCHRGGGGGNKPPTGTAHKRFHHVTGKIRHSLLKK